MNGHDPRARTAALDTPLRNRYFHGRLMNVPTFELETEFFLRRSHLFTRLAMGYGVVCGLDVAVAGDGGRIRVDPGLAVDRWGRQVVVPARSEWLDIPRDVMESAVERAGSCREDAAVQVLLCYHECVGDPVPAYPGDCGDPYACEPSTVRERYRVEFRDKPARKPPPWPRVPGLVRDGRVDHEVLARWVSRGCPQPPADSCVTLADLKVEVDDKGVPHCPADRADIAVRPVMATNTVLTGLLVALLDQSQSDY
ncbi:hypothetical protein [Streptomyces sp. Tu102]|uniref:hypothetical protein n=1 Tax=Streptomyces sp. Tu102 TaxID=2838019 RepID=UPI001BDDC28F|nr:hypothetical protein [Streptomyces sp. Tu102]MBT1090326.1 hypothetical protein [Streptomyces sp. Tu102]